MAFLIELLDSSIGIQLQEIRVIADESLRVNLSRQRLVLTFFDGFYIKRANARSPLDILNR